MSLSLRPVSTRPQDQETRAWSDSEFLEGILSGDRKAALPLYQALRPVIDHALRRVLHGRPQDFDDLMQSTFERVLTTIVEGRFEGRSSLRTWASAIAGHVALDALRGSFRSAKRVTTSSELVENQCGPRPEARLEALSELARLQTILSQMNEDMAEAIVLHDVLGHKLEEIAELMGATPSATQSRLHRGRVELRRRLSQEIVRKV